MGAVRLWPAFASEWPALFKEHGMDIELRPGVDSNEYRGEYPVLSLFIKENNRTRAGTLDDILKIVPGTRNTAMGRLHRLCRHRVIGWPLSARLRRLLEDLASYESIDTPEKLASLTESEVRRLPNCGRVTLAEMKTWLASKGLSLKSEQS